jgi:hypothetical protein
MNLIIFSIGLISFGGLVVLGVALWIYFEMRKKETAKGHEQQSSPNDNAT